VTLSKIALAQASDSNEYLFALRPADFDASGSRLQNHNNLTFWQPFNHPLFKKFEDETRFRVLTLAQGYETKIEKSRDD
jgi:hypothetical protein